MGCGFRHQKKSPVSWGLISQSTELQVGGPVSASLNVRQFSCQVNRALWSPGPAVLVLLFPAWYPPCSCNPGPGGLVSPILGRRRLGDCPLPILRPAFRAMFEPGKMPGPPARGRWFLGLGFNSLAAAHWFPKINKARIAPSHAPPCVILRRPTGFKHPTISCAVHRGFRRL
jgi:hypothetical protein